MEAFGVFLDEEWESLSKLFSCEDSEFLMHFNGHSDGSSVLFGGGENVADGVQQPLCFPSGAFDANFYFCSLESSNSSEADEGALFGASPQVESQPVVSGANLLNCVMANAFECMDFGAMEGRNDGLMLPVFPDVMDEIIQLKGGMSNNCGLGGARMHPAENGESCKEMQLKRKLEAPGIHTHDEGNALQSSEPNFFDQSPKKRSRVSSDAQKNKTRKSKKAIEINTDGEENNGGGNGQSWSTCSSEEDDSNASQELNAASISESKGSASNGKAKANRGPATDAQSLYARRRRERINERLRILQNLVPNGTKVDISTMLEEAVHYVKFLQLQIKLLSSDDQWMYAPIAYNGMDIGLYR